MNKILTFLGLLSIVCGVNGCGRRCEDDSACADINPDTNYCCNACCPEVMDCYKPNICGLCDDDPTGQDCTTTTCPLGYECHTTGKCKKRQKCVSDADCKDNNKKRKCQDNKCVKPVACTEEAKICADGSVVVREGPYCEFGPCAGDKCEDCVSALKCPCGLCADDITQFGCCQTCQYERNSAGDLECSGIISFDRVCCCAQDECRDVMGECVTGNIFNCKTAPCSINNNGCKADEKCTDNYCNGCNAVCIPCQQFDGYCIDPDGNCAAEVNCFVSPCSINNGGCPFDESCNDNYCGGCFAVCECDDNQCIDPYGNCADKVNCFMDPCNDNNGGCGKQDVCIANYCGGCNVICITPCERGEEGYCMDETPAKRGCLVST